MGNFNIAASDDHADDVRASVIDGFEVLTQRSIRVLLSNGANTSEAREHAQAALVETYVAADRIVEPEAVFGYATTIAKRSLWRERRRVARSEPVEHDALPEAPATSADLAVGLQRASVLKVLREALAELSQRDRNMLWEHHVDGASCEELAQTYGLARSSVPTILLRIRRRLRGLLEPHGPHLLA